MNRFAAAAIILAASALTATACSSSTKNGTAAPATSPAPVGSAANSTSNSPSNPEPSRPTGSSSGATVALAHTSLGTFLVDAKGNTLYLFEKDTSSTSNCTGACASSWPPDTTSGTPHAGTGVNAALLGTTMRADHTMEVTYNGHPLYSFVGDRQPGDTNGEGSKAFGASWYVVAPNGSKIDNS